MEYPSTSGHHNNTTNSLTKSRVDTCFVPMCPSTSTKFPNKLFLTGPSDPKLRKKWFQAAKRDDKYSPKTVIRCCEDHFDLENDLKNWIKFKIVGGNLFLRKDVVPHIFECQNRMMPLKPRAAIIKRKRIEILESIENTPVPQTPVANVSEVLSEQKANKYVEASPASPSTTPPPSPSQGVGDAETFVTKEEDDGDDSDTPVKSNMCRVCLALDVKMYDLRNNELKTMFQNITGIMFNENNYSVLGSLCWECAARLKAAATFRSKALLSDSLLQVLITSGEQIRKNHISALKENALSQGLISANTLTAIDVFHIVDIEDQNNTNHLLESGDDGEQTSLSKRFIVEEINEFFSETNVEDDNIAIKSEIECDPLNPEEENRTKVREERPVDITFSSEDNTVKSTYSSLLMDMGLKGERNSQGNREIDINKTVLIKNEDDNNFTIKTEIDRDPLDSTSSSPDKINSASSSLQLDIGHSSLRSDIHRSPQEDSDTENTFINTITKSDQVPRRGPQQTIKPTNPTKRKKYGILIKTSHL